jgi:hypothetical protein
MAWSPARRSNAGRFEVEHPGDYAAFNSYQPGYGTSGRNQRLSAFTDGSDIPVKPTGRGRLRVPLF